jgi:hypothetical protein
MFGRWAPFFYIALRDQNHLKGSIVLHRETHNGQVTENHDLRTVAGSVKERSGNAVFIGNSDGREESRTPSPRRCHTGGSQTSPKRSLRNYIVKMSR